MKKIKVYGVGNALVDLIVPITEKVRESLDLEKGTMRLVSIDEQADLIKKLDNPQLKMVSGGSVANSIYALSQLGVSTAFSGAVGDDKYGLFYKSEFEAASTVFCAAPLVGATTGTCLVCVTPDGERTMRTCLATSSDFSVDNIDFEIVKDSEWVFIEGYLLANPGKVSGWLTPLLAECKKHGTKVAFTCSESWVLENFKESVSQVLEEASFIFANEQESCSLANVKTIQEASQSLKDKFQYTCLTAGEMGALVSFNGKAEHVPAFLTEVIDLNGAGDICAAGFLASVIKGRTISEAGKLGCFLASNLIQHSGARYPGSLSELEKELFGSVAD